MGKAKGSKKGLFAKERAASTKVKAVDQNKPPAKPGKRKSTRSARAMQLVEEFGLCPISMEPMRRPVLPSSGQAYDEINIVRFSAAGRKRCPVSGATMKFAQSSIVRTPDYALRSVIRHQARQAKVYIPPLDREELVQDMRSPEHCQDAVKAFVDDVYLGYLHASELHAALEELMPGGGSRPVQDSLPLYCQIIAECLACRRPGIVSAALQSVQGSAECNKVLADANVLRECLGVGEDPDSRANVLIMLEAVFEASFSHKTALQVLLFSTESVPVQQSQARIADKLLCGAYAKCTDGEQEQLLNKALKIRADLHGCLSSGRTHIFWAAGLKALMKAGKHLDTANMDRLFWRRNQACLAHLCAGQPELLMWHFARQPLALQYLVSHIAASPSSSPSYNPLQRHAEGLGEDAELDELWSDLQADYGSHNEEEYEHLSHMLDVEGESDDMDEDDEEDYDSDDESFSELEAGIQPSSEPQPVNTRAPRRSVQLLQPYSNAGLSGQTASRSAVQSGRGVGGRRAENWDQDDW